MELPMSGLSNASEINNMTYIDYYERLMSIALSIFEWRGLPDSCNPRFLELVLYGYGRAIFCKDPLLGYLTLKVTPSGELNVYNESLYYTAYGIGYNQEYDRDNCVLIRNNYLERPTDYTIRLFASRLTEAERTIDVNLKAQKTPVLIKGDEKDRMTMKNLYKQYDGNEPFIMGAKSLNIDNITVLKTDAPYVVDKVLEYKKTIWNEAMSFLGVNNADTEKKERLITDEVNANNDLINIMNDTFLLTRKEACEKINKMYGLDVSVDRRSYDEILHNIEESEVLQDGKVHDGTSGDCK